MSVNKVFLVGRLGQDPRLEYTQSGQPVCHFSIATTERWTDKSGEKKELTQWTNVVVWGSPAENVGRYLQKGSQVHVEGRLQTREFQGKDGTPRRVTEVISERVTFLSAKSEPRGTQGQSDETIEDPGL